MSTRGFVGIGTAEHWSARYSHFDSYPTGLGAEAWATAQRFLREDRHLNSFAKLLLRHTNWRQVANGGRCEYCGKITGQPCSISGRLFVPPSDAASLEAYVEELRPRFTPDRVQENAEREWIIIENRRTTGYPDPEAKYHEHDTRDPEESAITPSNCDWLFMEFGYIVDPDRRVLHVFTGLVETPLTYTVDIIRPNGEHDCWTNKVRYTGALVGSYDLNGPEPNWDAIDAAAQPLRDYLEAEFVTDPQHPLLEAVRALPAVEVCDQREAVQSQAQEGVVLLGETEAAPASRIPGVQRIIAATEALGLYDNL